MSNRRLLTSLRNRAFSRRWLLLTNVTISVSLGAAGDQLQQRVKMQRGVTDVFDVKRNVRMSSCSALMGVMCHFWFLRLDTWLVGTGFRVVAKKVAADQLLYSPVMWACTIALMERMETHKWDWHKYKHRLQDQGLDIYMAECVVFPPAQALNFYLLPTRYRVLFDNTMSFAFDWFTSYILNDKH